MSRKIPRWIFVLGGKDMPNLDQCHRYPSIYAKKVVVKGLFEAIPAWVQVGATDHLRSEVAQVQVAAKFCGCWWDLALIFGIIWMLKRNDSHKTDEFQYLAMLRFCHRVSDFSPNPWGPTLVPQVWASSKCFNDGNFLLLTWQPFPLIVTTSVIMEGFVGDGDTFYWVGGQPNLLFTRFCLKGFVMSPCCYHARSRYVVNCGGRKLCREGRRCCRNGSDNSRRGMTSWWAWWHMASWNQAPRQHWSKAEQLRPVAGTCTKRTKDWVIYDDFSVMFDDSTIYIYICTYLQTLEIWTRDTENVLVWRGEISVPRDESNTWWQFVEINPVKPDTSADGPNLRNLFGWCCWY